MRTREYLRYYEELNQNPEYWGTAGAGILPVALDTGRFLLALRSDEVMEPGTIGIIGGKLDTLSDYDDEDDLEDPVDAALREFEEETRRSADIVSDLIPLYVFHDNSVGFVYYNFLGIVDSEFYARTNWETDEWMWLTLDELKKIRPKHFGLKALLNDRESMNVLRSYAK